MRQYNFSKNLKKYRKEKNMSQAELAVGIRVTQQTISAWETDERYPTLDKVYDIAKILDIPVNKLLTEENLPYT